MAIESLCLLYKNEIQCPNKKVLDNTSVVESEDKNTTDFNQNVETETEDEEEKKESSTDTIETCSTGRRVAHHLNGLVNQPVLVVLCLSVWPFFLLVSRLCLFASFFNPAHSEVYSIQHYVIKFVSDLRQVGGFLWLF
jgi:hypothetical protein